MPFLYTHKTARPQISASLCLEVLIDRKPHEYQRIQIHQGRWSIGDHFSSHIIDESKEMTDKWIEIDESRLN